MSKPTTSETSTTTISELEQHTAQLRSRIDDTLAELGHQLTPSHLGRVAAAKASSKLLRGSGQLTRLVKRHPRAALAVGVGLLSGLWLRRRIRG